MVCACAHGLGVPERIEGVADVWAVLVAFRGRAMSPRVKSRRQYGSSFCMLSWRAERSLSSAYNVVTFERKAIVRGVEWSSCEILCKVPVRREDGRWAFGCSGCALGACVPHFGPHWSKKTAWI